MFLGSINSTVAKRKVSLATVANRRNVLVLAQAYRHSSAQHYILPSRKKRTSKLSRGPKWMVLQIHWSSWPPSVQSIPTFYSFVNIVATVKSPLHASPLLHIFLIYTGTENIAVQRSLRGHSLKGPSSTILSSTTLFNTPIARVHIPDSK